MYANSLWFLQNVLTAPLAVLAVLQLCLLRYFPSTNLADRGDNCYTSLCFLFLRFFYVYSIQNYKICCYLLLLFFAVFISPLHSFYRVLFSTLLSIPFSVFFLYLFTLFSDLPYCFLFKSVILSFLFSYYSVLSASPLCSVPIQSVLFLLVFIILDTSV